MGTTSMDCNGSEGYPVPVHRSGPVQETTVVARSQSSRSCPCHTSWQLGVWREYSAHGIREFVDHIVYEANTIQLEDLGIGRPLLPTDSPDTRATTRYWADHVSHAIPYFDIVVLTNA